jgi:hypothetical protein
MARSYPLTESTTRDDPKKVPVAPTSKGSWSESSRGVLTGFRLPNFFSFTDFDRLRMKIWAFSFFMILAITGMDRKSQTSISSPFMVYSRDRTRLGYGQVNSVMGYQTNTRQINDMGSQIVSEVPCCPSTIHLRELDYGKSEQTRERVMWKDLRNLGEREIIVK